MVAGPLYMGPPEKCKSTAAQLVSAIVTRLTGLNQGNRRLLQQLHAADVPEKPQRPALDHGFSCAVWRHIGSGQPLGGLLLSDAMGRAERHLCP